MSETNLDRFIDIARSHRLGPIIPVPIESLKNPTQIEQWHREKGMLAFSLREPEPAGCMVDVLVRPDIAYERLAANATLGSFFGRTIKIAAIDDLLEMKRKANRPKDQLDINALEKIKRGEDPNG